MAKRTVYLPDDLDRWLNTEEAAQVNLSRIFRRGVIEERGRIRARVDADRIPA